MQSKNHNMKFGLWLLRLDIVSCPHCYLDQVNSNQHLCIVP
jgi:hypothetical protein